MRGIKPLMLVVMLICFVLALPVAWPFLGQHQKDRITNFVNPEQDLKGSGYQVYQSKIAIGSGGALGKGIFKGSQNQWGFFRHGTPISFFRSLARKWVLWVALTLGLLGLSFSGPSTPLKRRAMNLGCLL